MIPIKVSDLQPGDIIKLTENGMERTVKKVCYPSYDAGELRCLDFASSIDVTMPAICEVIGVTLYRLADVPCAVCKKVYKAQFDLAKGGTPRAVLCQGCDDTTTAEVLRRMKEE